MEQVLVEAHRPEVEKADAPDGHAERVLGQREFEERPRGDHRELGELFGEPSELAQDRAGSLDLVEEQQRSVDRDVAAEQER